MDAIDFDIPAEVLSEIESEKQQASTTMIPGEHLCTQIKDLRNIYRVASANYPEISERNLLEDPDSYGQKFYSYRRLVAALTANEETHLTQGSYFTPFAEFCTPGQEDHCTGKVIVGKIESEGKVYTVIGGGYLVRQETGLGNFADRLGVSRCLLPNFMAVTSLTVAKYLSEKFGRLVFDLIYGGSNCNYKWID